jgi:hypothetical protein
MGNQMIVEAGRPPKISRNCNASSLLTGPKPLLGFPRWEHARKNDCLGTSNGAITIQHMSLRRSASKRLTNRQAMTAARAEYFMAIIHSDSDGKLEAPRHSINMVMRTYVHYIYVYGCILAKVCTYIYKGVTFAIENNSCFSFFALTTHDDKHVQTSGV